MVERLVSGRRTWRRQLYSSAYACGKDRHTLLAQHFLQRLPLCRPPLVPWILSALASIIVFPNLDALREAFPTLPEGLKWTTT